MIVSHKHQFIYFAVPRTATHSVRTALEPHLAKDDWRQEGLSKTQRLPVSELAKAGHGHIGVRALRPHLSEEQWFGYYKFGFVRHPYDRFISVCAFLNRDNDTFACNPTAWMLQALDRERFTRRLLVKPQVDMLVDHDGELAVDFIGRFESLSAALSNVSIRTGVQGLKLPHLNSSPRSADLGCLTPELIDALNAFYRRDFDMLGYLRTQT